MGQAYREFGRTIRFVVVSNERTARLIALTIICVIAWHYFH